MLEKISDSNEPDKKISSAISNPNEQSLSARPIQEFSSAIAVRDRVVTVHQAKEDQLLNEFEGSIQPCFMQIDGDVIQQTCILEGLLLAANNFARSNSVEEFGSVLAMLKRTLDNEVTMTAVHTEIRRKLFNFLDGTLQLEGYGIAETILAADEIRLMALSCSLGLIDTLFTDSPSKQYDSEELAFSLTKDLEELNDSLDEYHFTELFTPLTWTAIMQLGNIAESIANPMLSAPLYRLFQSLAIIAGSEEDFLLSEEDEDDEESEFADSLDLDFQLEDDTEEDDSFESLDYDELGIDKLHESHMFAVPVTPEVNAEAAMHCILRALTTCQLESEYEELWTKILSRFDYENCEWMTGLIGLFRSNPSEAIPYIRQLLVTTVDIANQAIIEADQSTPSSKPGEADPVFIFELIIELLTDCPESEKATQDIFLSLPPDQKRTLIDVYNQAQQDQTIFLHQLGVGERSCQALEETLAKIFKIED